MKIRNRNAASTKIEMQMSSMIDVVFQLLIFFMLTLKIVEAEGDFDINMPLGKPETASQIDADLPIMKVRMLAAANGDLADLKFNNQSLGADAKVFDRLNVKIGEAIRRLNAAGPSNVEKQEVEIDPDYNLDYKFVTAAISSCSGRLQDGTVVPYIRRIKFAPIRTAPGQ
ncbi:MAG: biopolymer transporter ExbD [Fuerstiella sp.]